ncbi:hypothetical protein ACS0TY_023536 [Phlomoides rotata]
MVDEEDIEVLVISAQRKGKGMMLPKVADELVAEFVDPSNSVASPDQILSMFQFDILCWKGLPRTSLDDIEELKNRIEKKKAYLEELEDQYVGLQNLIERNKQLYGSGNAPSGGVALPFILV